MNLKSKLKMIDLTSLQKKKKAAEDEFNALREEAVRKQEEWKVYIQETNTKLIQLQGAFQAISSLLNDAEKSRQPKSSK